MEKVMYSIVVMVHSNWWTEDILVTIILIWRGGGSHKILSHTIYHFIHSWIIIKYKQRRFPTHDQRRSTDRRHRILC